MLTVSVFTLVLRRIAFTGLICLLRRAIIFTVIVCAVVILAIPALIPRVLVSLIPFLTAVISALVTGIAVLAVVSAIRAPLLGRIALVILPAIVSALLILLPRRAILRLLRVTCALLICRRPVFGDWRRLGYMLRLWCGCGRLLLHFPRYGCGRFFFRCRRGSLRLCTFALCGGIHAATVHDDINQLTLTVFCQRFYALQFCNLTKIVQAFLLKLFSCHNAAPFKKALKNSDDVYVILLTW